MSAAFLPGTLFGYVFGRAARGVAVAFVVVTGIIMLVDFVEANRDVGGSADVSALQLLFLTLLKTPGLIEQTIPFVVLFGMMGAIHGMNRRSELIVMRASGHSVWGIVRPALWLAALIGLLWSLAFNPLASRLNDTYDALSVSWLDETPVSVDDEVWLREGRDGQQIVIRAGQIDLPSSTLADATFLVLDVEEDGRTRFTRRYDAAYAELVPRSHWALSGVTQNAPGAGKTTLETVRLPTALDPETLLAQTTGERPADFWSMRADIRTNEQAGFSARGLRLRFNRLLSLPVLLVAMTIIAAGVSMSLIREGGTLRLLIIGAVLGFGVFFADSLVVAFGEVAVIPVVIAAWSVPLIVMMLGVGYLARIEDG